MSRSRVIGASRLRRTLKRWPDELTEEITREMRAAAIVLESSMEQRAPVDTGRLQPLASAAVSKDGLGLSAGFSKKKFRREWKRGGFYAKFSEFGTKEHSAQPFIRPTWRAHIGGILDKIDRAVMNALQNAKSK